MAAGHPKVVTVIGSTATGKSDLAVELALAAGTPPGEIINADSMQVYAGLDTITNKVTVPERKGVPHHLMSFLEPGREYSIPQFQKDATSLVQELSARSALPVLVGGTHYYLQHLLFPDRLVATADADKDGEKRLSPAPHPDLDPLISSLHDTQRELFLSLPTLPHESPRPPTPSSETSKAEKPLDIRLHELLAALDPPVAARWHPRDMRKVRRSLEIMWETGQKRSEILKEQAAATEAGAPQVRFRNLVFWVYSEPKVLAERLDKRVDKMLERGLLKELEELRAIAARGAGRSSANGAGSDTPSTDYTRGIFQAIGYKEFDPYLTTRDASAAAGYQDEAATQKLFNTGLESMKVATRQYAKRQVKWIRNNILPAIQRVKAQAARTTSDEDAGSVDLFMLDSSDIENWQTNVLDPAKQILNHFLSDRPLPDPRSLSTAASDLLVSSSVPDPATSLEFRRKIVCPVCTVNPHRPVLLEVGKEWDAHQASRAHRKMTRTKRGPPPGHEGRSKTGRDGEKKESAELEDLSLGDLY